MLFSPVCLFGEGISDFDGRWEIIPGKSIDLGRFGGFVLDIKTSGNDVTILKEKMRRGRDLSSTMEVKVGETIQKEITAHRFPGV
ncbi:MAG: hypothetical protein JKY51_10920, partial [Opitutaceae bacterium]|nr:hypothetical protein [Opitutaceae bacterium]